MDVEDVVHTVSFLASGKCRTAALLVALSSH